MDILDQMEAWRKNARFISEQDFFSRMMSEIVKNRKEIERLRNVVALLIEYEEHDKNILKGAVMWEALIEAAHRALMEKE